jgi:hypothetical protein
MLANMAYNDDQLRAIEKNYALPWSSVQIYQPAYNISHSVTTSTLVDKETLVSIIEGVSKTTDTPFIIRSYYVGRENDGNGNVNWLAPISVTTFFETHYKNENFDTYWDHGQKSTFAVKPLSEITNEEYQGASIFFENNGNKDQVLSLLSQKINAKFSMHTTPQSLTKQPDWYWEIPVNGRTNDLYIFFIKISVVFFLVFLFIWLASNHSKVAIYKLNGASDLKIVSQLFMKEFSIIFFSVYLISSFVITHGLSLEFTFWSLLGFLGIALVSCVPVGAMSGHSIANHINNKPFLKKFQRVIYGVKVYIFAASVATAMGIVLILNTGMGSLSNSKLANYGVLYEAVTGYSINLTNTYRMENSLYYANTHGAITAAPSQAPLSGQFSNLTCLQVNANYLDKFAVIDDTGKQIRVSNNETEGVILLNENLKSKKEQIESQYIAALKDADSVNGFKTAQLKFYWIKSDQKVAYFTASNATELTNANLAYMSPEVVEVYTAQNASGVFGEEVYHGDSPVDMLYPLIDHSLSKTYKSLLPALEADANAGSEISFVSTSEIAKTNALFLIGDLWEWVFMNLFAFILFLAMIVATIAAYFNTYRKNIAIKRLNGASWIKTHGLLMGAIVAQYILYFSYSILTGFNPLIVELFIIYFVFELFILLSLIRKLEKQMLVSVLKGE